MEIFKLLILSFQNYRFENRRNTLHYKIYAYLKDFGLSSGSRRLECTIVMHDRA